MRYEFAEDLQKLAEEISESLFPHVEIDRIKCFRQLCKNKTAKKAHQSHPLGIDPEKKQNKIFQERTTISKVLFRSFGTLSKRTIARCHALGKLMQMALEVKAFYPLEFLSERFDKLSFEEQVKVIIHELMHIPKTFGGGFRHHDFVTDKNVNSFYKQFVRMKNDSI